jgi:hypothetical protein
MDLDMIEPLSAQLDHAKENNKKLAAALCTKDEKLNKKDKDIAFLKDQIKQGKRMFHTFSFDHRIST